MKSINYVTDIDNQKFRLKIGDKAICGKLRDVGAKKGLFPKVWFIPFSSLAEQVELIRKIIELDIPFVGGVHGWPPSEQLAQLRDEGRIKGRWKEIVWESPNEPIVRDR